MNNVNNKQQRRDNPVRKDKARANRMGAARRRATLPKPVTAPSGAPAKPAGGIVVGNPRRNLDKKLKTAEKTAEALIKPMEAKAEIAAKGIHTTARRGRNRPRTEIGEPVSTIEKLRVPKNPRITKVSENQTIVEHTEFLGALQGSKNFALQSFPLVISEPKSFPRGSQEALNFQNFKFVELSLHFTTAVGTFTNGQVILAINPNAQEAAPKSITDMMSLDTSRSNAPYKDISLRNPKVNLDQQKVLTIPDPTKPIDPETLPLYSAGNAFIASQGIVAQNGDDLPVAGYIYMKYKVSLTTPKTNDFNDYFAEILAWNESYDADRFNPFGITKNQDGMPQYRTPTFFDILPIHYDSVSSKYTVYDHDNPYNQLNNPVSVCVWMFKSARDVTTKVDLQGLGNTIEPPSFLYNGKLLGAGQYGYSLDNTSDPPEDKLLALTQLNWVTFDGTGGFQFVEGQMDMDFTNSDPAKYNGYNCICIRFNGTSMHTFAMSMTPFQYPLVLDSDYHGPPVAPQQDDDESMLVNIIRADPRLSYLAAAYDRAKAPKPKTFPVEMPPMQFTRTATTADVGRKKKKRPTFRDDLTSWDQQTPTNSVNSDFYLPPIEEVPPLLKQKSKSFTDRDMSSIFFPIGKQNGSVNAIKQPIWFTNHGTKISANHLVQCSECQQKFGNQLNSMIVGASRNSEEKGFLETITNVIQGVEQVAEMFGGIIA